MAITTADGWFAAAKQRLSIIKNFSANGLSATQLVSMFDIGGTPGAGSLTLGNITTGLVPVATDVGFPLITAFGGGATGYLASAQFRNSVACGAILYDRLWHAGSVSMLALATTSFSAQPSYTGRLPNAGADFGNLEILLEINAAVSATATTVSVNYTNEVGITGRTTGASSSLSGFLNRRVLSVPLQAGDKGVQKIESVTVGGVVATTGTFNVVVARRLADFDVRISNGLDSQGWDQVGGPVVFANSALWPVFQPDSTASGVPTLGLSIING